jgi:hypothetical protein
MSSLSETNLTKHSQYRSRNYSGIIGLQVDGVEKWSKIDVEHCVYSWLESRIKNNEIVLSPIVGQEEMLYYEYKGNIITEPCIRVYGEVASRQNHLSDEEIVKLVYSLFEHIKIGLNQETVRFTYTGYTDSISYRIETL